MFVILRLDPKKKTFLDNGEVSDEELLSEEDSSDSDYEEPLLELTVTRVIAAHRQAPDFVPATSQLPPSTQARVSRATTSRVTSGTQSTQSVKDHECEWCNTKWTKGGINKHRYSCKLKPKVPVLEHEEHDLTQR
jgi:hypothetical protein